MKKIEKILESITAVILLVLVVVINTLSGMVAKKLTKA